jgi:hypothetical protein
LLGQQQYMARDTESPREIRARSGTNGFRQYRTKKREGFCGARTASLCLYGGDVQGDVPRGTTADKYGQTGLKWPECDKCCQQAFIFTKQITGEVAAKELQNNLKLEHAGSGDKKE